MAKREGEPSVKQPTVPAPHPLAELIAQMLTGVAHVPRVEQARMVADAAKAAAKWHDARATALEAALQTIASARRVKHIGITGGGNPLIYYDTDQIEQGLDAARAALAAKEVGRG